MRPRETFANLLAAAVALMLAVATARAESQTILVFPFENLSKNLNRDWMGESFVEILSERLAGEGRYIFAREERLAAADRLGLPAHSSFSRATLLKIAEELGADYIVLGSYRADGATLTASVQILDLQSLRLSTPASEAGRLEDLIEIQTNLAWQILRTLDPTFPLSKRAFAERFPPLRLNAFESYLRGLLASTQAERARLFLEAARLDPLYGPPAFQLGRIYFQNKDYRTAIPWLRRLAPEDPRYLAANFYLGLCYLGTEDYARAGAAFALLAERLPLNEVFNNLGVAESRQGKLKEATEHLNRARDGDPLDADYAFNLGLNAWRGRDWAKARAALGEAVALRDADEEARTLLARLAEAREDIASGQGLTSSRAVGADQSFERADRIKTNYDEIGFRHLQMELKNAAERKLAPGPRSQHVALHLSRGQELFAQGRLEEARREFTEAVLLAPDSHQAHLFLGRIYEMTGKPAEAIRELRASVWSQESVAARLLLTRLYLRQERVEDAAAQVRAALALDPQNAEARSLQQVIAARRGLATVATDPAQKNQ